MRNRCRRPCRRSNLRRQQRRIRQPRRRSDTCRIAGQATLTDATFDCRKNLLMFYNFICAARRGCLACEIAYCSSPTE